MNIEEEVQKALSAGSYSVLGALENTTPNHLKSNVLSICLTTVLVEYYKEQAKEDKDAAFEYAKTDVNEAFNMIMANLNKAHFGEQPPVEENKA